MEDAKLAKRNGIGYASIFVMEPDRQGLKSDHWFANATCKRGDERVANAGDFYWEGEL